MNQAESWIIKGKTDEAFPLLKKEAEKGSARAMYLLGRMYEYGMGHVQKDEDEAALWYEKGAAGKDPLASLAAARWLGQGERYHVMEWAFPEARKMAEGQDLFAMMELADMYLRGGIMINLDEGMHLLIKASAADYWHAWRELGLIYKEGFLVDRDLAKAETCFAKAAAYGDPVSEYELSVLWYDGPRTAEDREKAYSLFQKAWKDGSADAAYHLALIFEEGRGMPRSDSAAFLWYSRAAAMNHVLAMGGLAYCYEKGLGIPVDQEKAMSLYEKAAEAGDDASLLRLAMMKWERKDRDAPKYLKEAADNGLDEAALVYGLMLIRGEGIEEDREAGINYLREAADRGYEAAEEALHHVYMDAE
jgi:TPR repeat protein